MMNRKPAGRTRLPAKPKVRLMDPIAMRTAEIVRTTGLAPGMARQVATGKMDLNEVVKRMAVADEVNRIMVQHELNRALATQIVLGHASLDAALCRRRIDTHLAAHADRAILERAATSQKPISLGLHGHRIVRGVVVSVDKYEFVFRDAETGAETVIHKLQVKYAYEPDDYKKVKKAMDYDKVRREKAVEPVARPQDRFGCSDRRLGTAWDKKTHVTAITLEGECFSGEVAWVARFEFGLRPRSGGEVVLMRHALDDFQDSPVRR